MSDYTLINTPRALANPTSRPLAPTPAISLGSDRFTGGNAADITGRTLDAQWDGATNLTWVTNLANAFALSSGRMTRGSATGAARASVATAHTDIEAGFLLRDAPISNGHSIYLDVRLNADANSSSARSAYRLQVTFDLTLGLLMRLVARKGGSSSNLGSVNTPVQLGDNLAIQVTGTGASGDPVTVRSLRNRQIAAVEQDTTSPIVSGTNVDFEVGSNALFGVDDFYFERPIPFV